MPLDSEGWVTLHPLCCAAEMALFSYGHQIAKLPDKHGQHQLKLEEQDSNRSYLNRRVL